MTMTRDEVVNEVAARLGNRTDLNTKILNALDHVQRFVMERYPILPWFLITENLNASTVPGEPRLQVPTGFLREVENGALWRQMEDDSEYPWLELKKKPHDALRAALGNEIDKEEAPTHYALLGQYWILAPIPNKVYTIHTRIYQRDLMASELSSGAESNKWMENEAEFLISEAVLRLARHLQWEQGLLSEFRRDRDEARRSFFINEEARIHANQRYQMGITRGV